MSRVVSKALGPRLHGAGDQAVVEGDPPYYRMLGRSSVDIIKHGGYKVSPAPEASRSSRVGSGGAGGRCGTEAYHQALPLHAL